MTIPGASWTPSTGIWSAAGTTSISTWRAVRTRRWKSSSPAPASGTWRSAGHWRRSSPALTTAPAPVPPRIPRFLCARGRFSTSESAPMSVKRGEGRLLPGGRPALRDGARNGPHAGRRVHRDYRSGAGIAAFYHGGRHGGPHARRGGCSDRTGCRRGGEGRPEDRRQGPARQDRARQIPARLHQSPVRRGRICDQAGRAPAAADVQSKAP